MVEKMKQPFVHRENDEKRDRNWLSEVFDVFFRIFNRDRSYLLGFAAKSVCVRFLSNFNSARMYV